MRFKKKSPAHVVLLCWLSFKVSAQEDLYDGAVALDGGDFEEEVADLRNQIEGQIDDLYDTSSIEVSEFE